jgi:hypothetical protein
VLVPLKVTVVLAPTATLLGEKLTVVPVGFPEALKLTFPLNPPFEAVPSVTLIDAGAGHDAVAGVVELKLNPKGGGMIVRFALLISKYTFPTAFTLKRTVVEGVLGTVKLSVPSFGVLGINSVNVVPPSVEMKIFTLEVLVGAPVVPLTDQVNVSVVPAVKVAAVLWDVIRKGPTAAETVMATSA